MKKNRIMEILVRIHYPCKMYFSSFTIGKITTPLNSGALHMTDQNLFPYRNTAPDIDPEAWVAPGARLIGGVTLKKNASVWFNAVLRADLDRIVIGEGSNIQDGCVVHVDPEGPCLIGSGVITGHNAVLHACTIGDGCLIGMGAIILSGATVGNGTIIAAGSLIKERASLEPDSLYAGNPARFIRKISPAVRERLTRGAALYSNLIPEYRENC